MVSVGTAGHVYLSVGDGATSDYVALAGVDNPNIFYVKGGFSAPPPAPGDYVRTVTLTLNITGASSSAMWANYRAIEKKLRQARAAQGPYGLGTGVTLGVQFDAADTMVYFDVLDGTLTTDSKITDLFPVTFLENVTLQLICLPYARGARQTATNLLLSSAAFDQSSWTKNAATATANTVAGPNGATVADSITEDTSTAYHFIQQNTTKAASALPYTFSVWLKGNGRNVVLLKVQDSLGNAASASYTLTGTGTISGAATVAGSFTSPSAAITTDPNDATWYRCSLTVTSSTDTAFQVLIFLNDGTSYTGDGASGVYAWGASLQQASTLGPYMETGSSLTITNGLNSTAYLYNIPGDCPALATLTLTDVSTSSTFINRWRIGQLALPNMASADFSPIIDATAVSPGTATTDSSSYIGASFARIAASTSWQTIASITKPSAQYTTGLFDVWVRIRDASGLLSTPTGLSGAAKNPIDFRQTAHNIDESGTSTTATVSWTNPTIAGNTVIAVVYTTTNVTHSTPTGYTAGDSPAITGSHTSVFYIQNASAQSGSVSVTLGAASNWYMVLLEAENCTVAPYDAHASNTGNGTTSLVTGTSGATAQAFELALAIFGTTQTINAVNGPSGYSTGVAATSATQGGLYTYYQTLTATGTQSATATASSNATYAAAILTLKSPSTANPALTAGTQRFVLSARDSSSGSTSVASVEVDVVVTSTQYVSLSWDAVSGANDYYLWSVVSGAWNYWDVGNVTSYVFAVTTGGTAGAPPNSATASGQFRLQIGLSSGTILLNQPAFTAQIANSSWELLYLGTVDLPPQIAADAGTPPNWLCYVQGMHNTATPNLDADAAWLFPHQSGTLTATYNDGSGTPMNLATLRAWRIDTRRDGRTSVQIQSTADGSEHGQAITTGHLFLGPSDTTLVLAPDITGGVNDVTNAKYQIGLTVVPRYALVSGTQ